MTRNLTNECSDHPDPAECPDALISYSEVFDEYGIWVHDGGSSSVHIAYCPWCGTKLPESRRDEWFDTIERLGFDDPSSPEIPPEFRSDAWYRRGA
jgi:uncharacterized protein DUF6980